MKWLFFSYSLPAEPSKARVYAWRQLKKLGAVNYQSSWVLPHSRDRIAELNKLSEDIKGYGGESLLVEGKTVDAAQEEKIKKAFTASRSEEYQELIEKCEDFFKEINFEIERKNFIFAEVEENEEELEKLKQWLKKIEKRDVLGVPLQKAAAEKIKTCEKMFDDFAKTVYLHTYHKDKTDKPAGEKIKKNAPKERK
jgi:hypothetical protein